MFGGGDGTLNEKERVMEERSEPLIVAMAEEFEHVGSDVRQLLVEGFELGVREERRQLEHNQGLHA